MAELLIRVKDKIGDTIYIDAQCTKRGDVIVVCPDGWNWGRLELSDPRYRIVRFPSLTVSEATAFTAEEMNTDPNHPSNVLQKRAFKFDVEHASIPAAFAEWLADDSRAEPIYNSDLSNEHVHSLRVMKPSIIDPAVIGGSSKVIG